MANEFAGQVVGALVHDIDVGGHVQDIEVDSVHIRSQGPRGRGVQKLIDTLGHAPGWQRLAGQSFSEHCSATEAGSKR